MPPRIRRRHCRNRAGRRHHPRGHPDGAPTVLPDRPEGHQPGAGREPEIGGGVFLERIRLPATLRRQRESPAGRSRRRIQWALPGAGHNRKTRQAPVVGGAPGSRKRRRRGAGTLFPVRDRGTLRGPEAPSGGLLRDRLGTVGDHQDRQPDDQRTRHAAISGKNTVFGRPPESHEQPAANTIRYGSGTTVWFRITPSTALINFFAFALHESHPIIFLNLRTKLCVCVPVNSHVYFWTPFPVATVLSNTTLPVLHSFPKLVNEELSCPCLSRDNLVQRPQFANFLLLLHDLWHGADCREIRVVVAFVGVGLLDLCHPVPPQPIIGSNVQNDGSQIRGNGRNQVVDSYPVRKSVVSPQHGRLRSHEPTIMAFFVFVWWRLGILCAAGHLCCSNNPTFVQFDGNRLPSCSEGGSEKSSRQSPCQ
mmetsp:Transcript_101592/g.206322  ORF Transcript_101592/g.206322 Transcript_101592/m.206322 type:complete len:421 (+) Transcript_101592:2416-3678(+)